MHAILLYNTKFCNEMLLGSAVDFDCERILQIGFHRQKKETEKKLTKTTTTAANRKRTTKKKKNWTNKNKVFTLLFL